VKNLFRDSPIFVHKLEQSDQFLDKARPILKQSLQIIGGNEANY